MATVNFNQIGSFEKAEGQKQVLQNPTSLQFGPDDRLYVSEQNGRINAFTIENNNGQYAATGNEELVSSEGGGVITSIPNHDDDGALNGDQERQVTGIVVGGTAANPVLYISSSDSRKAFGGDLNLDTNSGVVTRVTWTGTEWEAIDIVRGLPRSEENHAPNGMVLSPDGTKLYLAVGGNTNNGAPSELFSYTAEYALSGSILEIDLEDIESRPVLTDNAPGQDGRKYIYDLPTLDDPTVPNITDGVGEDEFGMDEAGPWGGNDGFNMAILPADAPLRIYADGFRNQYDLVISEAGELYTVDNGSNGGLQGGDPVFVDGEVTNLPNNAGSGNPEPLFLVEDGGYYGHPNPTRANQDLPWTVYNDDANPDESLSPNRVPNLADLVPEGVDMPEGFIIDPSKFTGDPKRLAESGVRVEWGGPNSKSLVNLGSSSNGLTEYTADNFNGLLKGGLLVTQFNSNITFLNLSDDGQSVEPLIDPGEDGVLDTDDDQVLDEDGVLTVVGGQSQPLDVTIGPDGNIWVADLGTDEINVFELSDIAVLTNLDFDGDGILNVDDPFIRDASNGGEAVLLPGRSLVWDFDPNEDNNLPGPNGYGGGLTGVMLDGSTDYEQFFQDPSTQTNQRIKLDNVKFTTASGGGTTVIENVSQGDAYSGKNNGEYLFQTGLTVAPTVDDFTIKWSVFNPSDLLSGKYQQIGGYIGTGDQRNYLKITAIQHPQGELEVLLEDNNTVVNSAFIQADDLFTVPANQKILLELDIDPSAGTARPRITYETGGSDTKTVSGEAIDLNGTSVLEAIRGDYTIDGQSSGLAVGLYSSNHGQSPDDTFQAIFDGIEVTASGEQASTVLYRVNAGGPEVAATDDGPNWAADTADAPSSFLLGSGGEDTKVYPIAVPKGETVPESVPRVIFNTERWDRKSGSDMLWAFDVPEEGLYEVRLYVANGYSGTSNPGERIFDVAIEGTVPSNLDDIDLTAQFGHRVGGAITNTVAVTDGTLNIEFLHGGIENTLINGIEIIQLSGDTPPPPQPPTPPEPSNGEAVLNVTANANNVQISNFGQNSFQITNTGDKKIAQVDIDVTNALYPDSVFDPFGVAGDTASKPLIIDTDGNTGIIAPSDASYVGAGGTAGFEGLTLVFDDSVNNGFEPGETIGLSVDMDPNSVAGAQKAPLDAGTSPAWDVGGVSGAELIGSRFTVTFTDGTTAEGQLQGNNNQGGSRALASQSSPNATVAIAVNGVGAGGVGTYDAGGPTVIINGEAGQTARVVLTKGFIQPVTNEFFEGNAAQQAYAPTLDAQLEELAAATFPANNAVEFQTVDVVLTGENQNISSLFNFTDVAIYDFVGDDKLSLGFVASVIDPTNESLAAGPVTQPIYLGYEEPAATSQSLAAEPITGSSNAPFGFDETGDRPSASAIVSPFDHQSDDVAQLESGPNLLNDIENGQTGASAAIELTHDLGNQFSNPQIPFDPAKSSSLMSLDETANSTLDQFAQTDFS